MNKARFPLAIVLVLLAAGCAQTPLKNSQTLAAEAARFRVSPALLVGATDAGYHPTMVHGATYFCTEQGQSFSYIPKVKCLDTAQMAWSLHVSANNVSVLERRINQMPVPRPQQN